MAIMPPLTDPPGLKLLRGDKLYGGNATKIGGKYWFYT